MKPQLTRHPQLTFIIRELSESLAASRCLIGEVDVGVEAVYAAWRLLGLRY